MPSPSKAIPAELLPAYTLGGRVKVEDWYLENTSPSGEPRFYSQREIESLREKVRRRENNYYGWTDAWLYKALERYPIRGQELAVMGSTVPWYEAIALEHGATVTTIEYNRIVCDCPDVKTLTVEEYSRSPRTFDAAFSISSFEHDGLGRYGDPLNPEGDLQAMRRMKSTVKPGGLLYLAVPVGKDKVVWNAHRIYGRRRLPLLLAGWKVVDRVGYGIVRVLRDTGKDGSYQPVWVLRNV